MFGQAPSTAEDNSVQDGPGARALWGGAFCAGARKEATMYEPCGMHPELDPACAACRRCCRTCGVSQPHTAFKRDEAMAGGRLTACERCRRPRVGEAVAVLAYAAAVATRGRRYDRTSDLPAWKALQAQYGLPQALATCLGAAFSGFERLADDECWHFAFADEPEWQGVSRIREWLLEMLDPGNVSVALGPRPDGPLFEGLGEERPRAVCARCSDELPTACFASSIVRKKDGTEHARPRRTCRQCRDPRRPWAVALEAYRAAAGEEDGLTLTYLQGPAEVQQNVAVRLGRCLRMIDLAKRGRTWEFRFAENPPKPPIQNAEAHKRWVKRVLRPANVSVHCLLRLPERNAETVPEPAAASTDQPQGQQGAWSSLLNQAMSKRMN